MRTFCLNLSGNIFFLLLWLLLFQNYNAVAQEPVRDRFVRLRNAQLWERESAVPIEAQSSPLMLIWEVTRDPFSAQTPEQARSADDLVERSFLAAERNGWFDYERGVAAGYQPIYSDRTHYANREYVLDDVVLDPERPEFLMYYESEGRMELAGFMFLVNEPLAYGPQIGGPETLWHYHRWSTSLCLLEGLVVVGELGNKSACERGISSDRSPEMIHVWLVDHPEGRFATSMSLDRQLLRRLVEARKAERGRQGY